MNARGSSTDPRAIVALLAALVSPIAIVAPSHAADSIPWRSIDGGGAIGVVSGPYRLSGTIGQHDAGAHAGGGFTLRAGFWRAGAGALVGAPVTPPPAPRFGLYAASPNPMRSQTRLRFDIPATTEVRLRVHDISGRVVHARSLGRMPAGHHERSWNAVDDRGRLLPGGVYFMHLEAGSSRGAQRVVVIR